LLKNILKKIPFLAGFYRWIKKQLMMIKFKKDFKNFKALSEGNGGRFSVEWKDRYPCLYDATADTGFDRHYVFHTAWAARILAKTKPKSHIDFSSSLYFVSNVSAFIPMKFYDYRPAQLNLSRLKCESGDLTALTFKDRTIKSLSCMHVVEHIGLGRYGDPVDINGDIKAMKELQRVLAKGGSLLFVVPVGKPLIMYNAHRIYSYKQIVDYFDELVLKDFSLIPDNAGEGGLISGAAPELVDKQDYGCGCFWFTRRK